MRLPWRALATETSDLDVFNPDNNVFGITWREFYTVTIACGRINIAGREI